MMAQRRRNSVLSIVVVALIREENREPPVAWVWLVRGRRQAEEVPRCPAERVRLLAPLGEKMLAILDRLLPAAGLDAVRAAGF